MSDLVIGLAARDAAARKAAGAEAAALRYRLVREVKTRAAADKRDKHQRRSA